MCTSPGCARSWKTTRRTRATFIPSGGYATASRHELVTWGVMGRGEFTAEGVSSPQRRSDAEISAEKKQEIKAKVKGGESAEEAELESGGREIDRKSVVQGK